MEIRKLVELLLKYNTSKSTLEMWLLLKKSYRDILLRSKLLFPPTVKRILPPHVIAKAAATATIVALWELCHVKSQLLLKYLNDRLSYTRKHNLSEIRCPSRHNQSDRSVVPLSLFNIKPLNSLVPSLIIAVSTNNIKFKIEERRDDNNIV